MAFVIDTTGNNDLVFPELSASENKETSIVSKLLKEYKESLEEQDAGKLPTVAKKDKVEEFTKEMGWGLNQKKQKKINPDPVNLEHIKRDVSEVLKKAVVNEDFEKAHIVPRFDVSDRRRKLEKKREESKTKGKKWYGLPATEVTEEIKNDLEVLQMRSALDPKRFYKKNDLKVTPKYFQIGKVVDSPLDFYNNRLTKKERKKTLVDELLADAEFNKFNKRKFKEIIEEKQKTHYKAWKQAKKLKKKKK